MFDKFLELPRYIKRIITLLSDAFMLGVALFLALWLNADPAAVFPSPALSGSLAGLTIVCSIGVFIKLGLYRAVIRYLSDRAILTIMAGSVSSVLILLLFSLVLDVVLVSGVFILYGALAFLFVGGTRLGVRMLINHPGHRDKKPVGIVGVGETARQLASALAQGTEYRPAAFFTLDPVGHLSLVSGIPVYNISVANRVVREQALGRLLLAVDSDSPSERQRILARLEPLMVPVQVVPSVSGMVSGRVKVADIRDLDVQDLLGREPVPVDQALLHEGLKGRSVLVTGAGGSIGSELCRQIIAEGPSSLILFEQSEYALYRTERELQAICAREDLSVRILPVLGSVLHRRRCLDVMQAHRVQVVYHAAAYKHVPLVESNPIEGVQNNVFGTWYAAEAAIEAGVERFVLVSTDKAVRPANIMGASKRLAELVLQGLATREAWQGDGTTPSTIFTMVRFGNVLGSSGSVVPLFRQQIREGGPVTVTHPHISRYFMTIPEAAQLVLQAGAMARGGEVFVLDMGEPVKIADLACKMIHLMGCTERTPDSPNGEIEIVFTGLRPGEKLYEELLIGHDPQGTDHPRIMMAREASAPWPYLVKLLDDLKDSSQRFDRERLVSLLLQAPLGYHPQEAELVSDGMSRAGSAVARRSPDNVRPLGVARKAQ
ncbi:polysaccharide biosynthesis protein [Marinobacter bryozoorum]|uniref:polysaccharide biosynthesis protein n=1 Tax=Marinobacter bryozoorum TaxID=256324 RepID=UPI0020063B3F|nr:nucleoside-diphosphate sugar epimerase/dehydratase [Marinobacter bryozoorum]MCK7545794.1 polysaccharide biosynthesis protein [Marinobacter bryozoorum]